MPAKHKPLVSYLDDTTTIQLEELRAYFSQKQGGVKITDSYIGRSLIQEKHTELVDRQNNRERITTIVEILKTLVAENQKLSAEVQGLRSEVNELKALVKNGGAS